MPFRRALPKEDLEACDRMFACAKQQLQTKVWLGRPWGFRGGAHGRAAGAGEGGARDQHYRGCGSDMEPVIGLIATSVCRASVGSRRNGGSAVLGLGGPGPAVYS
jgi:hypothetical protein